MDQERFDAIARAVGRGVSRRSVLGAVAGGLGAALGVGGAALGQGDSECANFCNAVFPPGPARGRCTSDAAHGEGLCAACGADPANVCLDDDGQPTCDCGCDPLPPSAVCTACSCAVVDDGCGGQIDCGLHWCTVVRDLPEFPVCGGNGACCQTPPGVICATPGDLCP